MPYYRKCLAYPHDNVVESLKTSRYDQKFMCIKQTKKNLLGGANASITPF